MPDAHIPGPGWINFDSDMEGIAGSEREVLSRLSMSPSYYTRGTITNDEGRSWWSGPPNPDFQAFNSFVPRVSPESHRNRLAGTVNVVSVCRYPDVNDSLSFYPRKPPPKPRSKTIPLPPVTHSHNGYDNPLGGGENIHQPTREWADASPRDGETSMSLAVTKPNNTENGNQSESSTPDARTTRRLSQICEALEIPSTGAELLTLQRIIVFFGGIVPSWITRADRNRMKEARRACYEELWRLVGPPTGRPASLRVLDSVLAKVTSQDNGALDRGVRRQPYRMVRLGDW